MGGGSLHITISEVPVDKRKNRNVCIGQCINKKKKNIELQFFKN